MPIYEYECPSCSERFSLLRRLTDRDEEIACPKCGTRHPKRLFSAFAARAGEGGKSSGVKRSDGCRTSGPFR